MFGLQTQGDIARHCTTNILPTKLRSGIISTGETRQRHGDDMMRHNKHVADDELDGRNPEYDRLAKKILSYKKLLAAILHHVVPEFKTVSRKDIEEKYIIGTPKVGTAPVNPGKTNKSDFRPPENSTPPQIRGEATEQSETGEGYITFDILFYAKVPNTGDVIQLIINIEAQKATPTGYPLMKRVI